MPQGFVHYRLFRVCYLIEIPEVFYLLLLNPTFAIAHFIGYSFHRYCDNDWDILGTNKAESRAIHELSILGYLLYGVSSIYGAIFMRKHRSFVTHFPLVSTAIRLLFLFWWLPILIFINHWQIAKWQWIALLGFWIGLSQADMIHWMADNIWSDDSKRFAEMEKRRR